MVRLYETYFLFKNFINFFRRGKGREKVRENKIKVWSPIECPLLAPTPATQGCALTANPTTNTSVCRLQLIPLSLSTRSLKMCFLFQCNGTETFWATSEFNFMCSYYGYISEVECLNFEKSYKVRHQLIVPLYILTPSVCEVQFLTPTKCSFL